MDHVSRDAANHHNKKWSSFEAASSGSTASSSRKTPSNATQQPQSPAVAAALGLLDPFVLFGKYLLINIKFKIT